jgi:hypothetical protein
MHAGRRATFFHIFTDNLTSNREHESRRVDLANGVVVRVCDDKVPGLVVHR